MVGIRKLLAAGTGAVALVGAGSATAFAGDGGSLIQFESMTGVAAGQTGVVNVRGIKGGGLPWVVGEAEGEVSSDGSVHVSVRGLVIPRLGNINPVKTFGATVSCLTPGGIVNVSTPQFPASRTGDSEIEATVSLPQDCGSPQVFVVAPSGAWFAVANVSTED